MMVDLKVNEWERRETENQEEGKSFVSHISKNS
jgi:hypothetical protein